MQSGDLLIATDLDGTLLDHHDYGFEPARSTLNRIRACGIPLILNTSKTRAELAPLQDELGLEFPFLVENGSALFLPANILPAAPLAVCADAGLRCRVLGIGYTEILAILQPLRARYDFEGFADWSPRQIAEATGLNLAQARLAQAREYSEPIVFAEGRAARLNFISALHARGLQVLQGGRFLHVMGRTDKAQGLDLVRDWYAQASARRPRLVCLGDSDNDVAMLECADIAIRVRAPGRAPPNLRTRARVITTASFGPRGWAEALEPILNEFGYPESDRGRQ